MAAGGGMGEVEKAAPLDIVSSSPSPQKEEELYRPSIVRYTCRGATYLDLDQPSSSEERHQQQPAHPFSFLGPSPRCVGVESRLRHIQDLPSPMTKERAIEKFVMETELPEDPDLHDPSPRQRTHMTEQQTSIPSSSTSSSSPTTTRNQPPPSSKGPTGGQNKKGRTILPNGVYDPYQHFVEQQHQVERIQKGDTVDEKDQFWTAWSCYGSTHVSMLLLQPYQDGSTHKADTESATISMPEEAGEVASVHLDCSIGASISETEDNYGGTTVTSLRLGPIELRIHNHFEFEELQDGNSNSNNRSQQPQQQESKQVVDRNRARPTNKEESSRPQTMLGRLMGLSSDDEEKNKQKSSSQKDQGKKDEEQPQEQDNKEEEDLGTKFVNMSKKVANGMMINAKFVAGEVSEEDFLERMVTSGEKIINQMPVTLQRTKKVVTDVYNMWIGEDGHDEDPN